MTQPRNLIRPEIELPCERGCRLGDCIIEKELNFRGKIEEIDRSRRIAITPIEYPQKREFQEWRSRHQWVKRLKDETDLVNELPALVSGFVAWASKGDATAQKLVVLWTTDCSPLRGASASAVLIEFVLFKQDHALMILEWRQRRR